MSCGHLWKKINDVKVCLKCGLTIVNGGIIFDRGLPNYRPSKDRRAVKK